MGGGYNSVGYEIVVPFAAAGITIIVFTYVVEYIGLFLPFINGDLVAGDLRRRMHELVMVTALPSWAYIWGRALFGVLRSIALAALVIPAYLIASVLSDGNLAALNFPALLLIWALDVLCPVVFLSGLGFALGTLLPRYANLVKVLLLIGWLTIFIIFRNFENHSWEAWDPTSAAWVDLHISPALDKAFALDIAVGKGGAALNAQARMVPDVSSIILPHLALALAGLCAILIAALTFRRFRNVMA